MSTAHDIIHAAVNARTAEQAKAVAAMIIDDIGEDYERPVADRPNTLGVLSTSSGSYEHRLLELNTNAHDAVLERLALRRFGSIDAVPYTSPREAAAELLAGMSDEEKGKHATVELYESDPPTRQTRRLTAVFLDQGCGLTPGAVSWTIFRVGSDHKDEAPWLQGAFGLGGATTYRNAQAVVLVTRRDPELLGDGEEDRITVAVCRWRQQAKGQGLYYPVVEAWDERIQSNALPWSAPAGVYPGFEVGTHLALISYEAPNFVRGRNDRRGFEFVQQTRMPAPILPTGYFNHIATGDHYKTLTGLSRRFADNPREDRDEHQGHVLFQSSGQTYHLPVSAYIFRPGLSADVGGKRNFVADPHAMILCSHGQAHQHWTAAELRRRCSKLNRAYDRLFIVVDTDPLPVELRTSLFTADRSGFINSGEADRLEQAVATFLNGWDPLVDYNTELIREALASRGEKSATRAIAEKIARAIKAKGFKLGGLSGKGDDDANPPGKPPTDLHPDPTTIEGPDRVVTTPGGTKYLRFHINAVDEFFTSGRGILSVTTTHPGIDTSDIAVGDLHRGRVRVALAVPDDAALGTFHLTAGVYDWFRSNGGLGGSLEWKTTLEIVDELAPKPPPNEKKDRKGDKPGSGDLVALQWGHNDMHPEWDNAMSGHVEMTPAELLAEDEEYAELASLGDTPIPTIWLNLDYSPLREYERVRSKTLTDAGVDNARDRYAVGAGVGMLESYVRIEKLKATNGGLDPEVESEMATTAARVAARATLAMMPEYDVLLREAGLEDDE